MWCSDHGVSHRSPRCKTNFSESHLPRQQGGTTAIQAHVMGSAVCQPDSVPKPGVKVTHFSGDLNAQRPQVRDKATRPQSFGEGLRSKEENLF